MCVGTGIDAATFGDPNSGLSDPVPKQVPFPTLRKLAWGILKPVLVTVTEGWGGGERDEWFLVSTVSIQVWNFHLGLCETWGWVGPAPWKGKELALIIPLRPVTHRPSEGWQDIWPCQW